MVIELLAILSASAAAGMRIALPLLAIGLLQKDKLWSNVPVLSQIDPRVLIVILISWSLFELLGSKQLLGQRILQIIQLIFSPLVGALMGITVARAVELEFNPIWLIGVVGGILALILKLVEIGWFFRLRGIPLWLALSEDVLCVFLVMFAMRAPQEGGLIALMLLWLAIRSAAEWRNWSRSPQKIDEKNKYI
ncbi:MAG: DUF4126 domain-containing protein [Prochloraceae cyanobacterium]